MNSWQKGELRVQIASKIVGHIFNQSDDAVGPATRSTRADGLRKADEILALVAGADNMESKIDSVAEVIKNAGYGWVDRDTLRRALATERS